MQARHPRKRLAQRKPARKTPTRARKSHSAPFITSLPFVVPLESLQSPCTQRRANRRFLFQDLNSRADKPFMQHWGERGSEASKIESAVIGIVCGAIALVAYGWVLLHLFR